MIAIGLSPNTQRDDVFLALATLLMPWRWTRGSAIKSLEDWFKRYFHCQFAIAFDSGRSCEYAILKALEVGSGDEVLIQAFTCVAVPNSILWNGARPIFIDIDDTGNFDILDLERKITPKSKAIIVQHTFGIAADIEVIAQMAKKHKLALIEDCAHALGATFKEKKIGTFGDFAFFSFGRDKVVSSVFGGMVITNNKKSASLLRNFQRSLAFPPFAWVFVQLLHPIAFSFILPLYRVFNLGKILLVFLQKIRLLSMPVDMLEKRGERPSFYPRRLPNAQAMLARHQLKKLVQFNRNRQEIASMYEKNLKGVPITLPKAANGDIFLRYNIQTQDSVMLYAFARKRGVLLGRWYASIIDPQGVDLERVGYALGSCPKAETFAQKSLNLPTHPKMTMRDAKKVIEVVQDYFYHAKH